MIEAYKFECLMKDLEIIFTPIELNKRDQVLEKYYEHLKNTDEDILKKAVESLIDCHPYKRFPLIQEIRETIKEVYNRSDFSKSEDDPVDCKKCDGIGETIEDREHLGRLYPTAIPCECEAGERWKRRLKKYKMRK